MADMYLGNESGGFDLVGTTNIKNIDFEEVKISKEDYENLSEEERKTGIHLVTGLDDTENGGGSADLISYDNTNSGLGSTNVQGAIDELNSKLDELMTVKSQNGNTQIFTLPKFSSTTETITFPKSFNSVTEVNVVMTRLDWTDSSYDPYYSCTAINVTEIGFLLNMTSNIDQNTRVQVSWSASI